MTNLFELNGGQPQKQPKYVTIFMDRAFTGLYTQRPVLHDPSDAYTSRYYGGRPDALLGGRNTELTNGNTLKRRPGMVPFRTTPGNGAAYATAPDRAFSFQLSDGTIRVIVDTTDSGLLTVTSCNNVSSSTTVYNGTFPGGGSNGYAGLKFTIAGFVTNPGNNGVFTCTASSTTTLTLNNTIGVAETVAATADTAGGVYWDKQDGTATLLVAKSAGAGQMYFIAVAGVLYMGDGVDTSKYTPLNTNGTIWNWGIVAPTNQPSVAETASGAAATVWQANTTFTTMGLTLDATNHIVWQLISVNADGSQAATAQFGTAGNGEPSWPKSEGSTLVDGGVTWLNMGAVNAIAPSTFYTDLGIGGGYGSENFSQPAAGSAVNTVYGNFKNSGGLGNTGTALPAFNGAYPGPSGGYFNNNTHWFAIGSYNTSTQMAAMRWKVSHAYSAWSPTGANASIAGTPGFVLTGNLPSASPVYLMIPKIAGTSSSGYTPFPATAVAGNTVDDNQLRWLCLGSSVWAASHAYTPWTAQGSVFSCIHDGANFQVCVKSQGSGLSAAQQPGSSITTATSITTSITSTTMTFTRNAGSWSFNPIAGQQITTSGFANATNNGTFLVISSTSNTIIVNSSTGIVETAASGVIILTAWGTGYGTQTVDGGITWTCVGVNVAWVAGSGTSGIWHLPINGFQPPGPSQQFGGSEVNASGFVQAVISSGKSGTSIPTFPTTIGNTVNDTNGAPSPTITWQTVAAVSTQSLAWSFGLAYAYSYKARPVDDFYSPLPLGGGATPPGGTALGAPFGSETNAISSASPVNQVVGANTGSVNTISGDYSADPQVDTIIIWRSADSASGSDNMFELTEIPNIPALAGSAKWKFNDFLPSVATGSFPGLNVLLPAPIDGVNDPPNAAFLPQVYNYQRIWGSEGQQVNFSGGPDTNVGNPNEAFNAADELPFLAPVTRLIKTPQGIVTFLTDSIEMIGGGPATATFFSVTMAPGVGLLSYNACDVYAGEIYFFAADNQFRVITPSLNLSTFGFPLGDQFANTPLFGSSDTTWNPTKVYVAVHQNGTDNCIFVADGSTGWYRLNPHQVPGGAQGPEPIWSPFAVITGGVKMVQSVETSPGIKQLLAGGTAPGDDILSRSLTTFTDDGATYDAFFTMGSISVAKPGQLALLKFLEFDFSGVAYQPVVSYLLNEISGSFTPFVNSTTTNTPQFDPPTVYGRTISPTSYSPNRYYFSSNASLARARHMQIKVDFGSTSNGDEMYSLSIYGRTIVEE